MSSVTIIWNASVPATVNITGASFSVSGSPVTFPYTMAATTRFDTADVGGVSVSVKLGNVEVARANGTAYVTRLENDGLVIKPSAEIDEILTDMASLPGAELGASMKTNSYTTTATTITTTPITGLSVTVIGTGRAVDVEFICTNVYHSVASTAVTAHLLINAVATTNDSTAATVSSVSTSAGRTLVLRRRIVLTAGASYTFEIGSYGGAAGTCNFVAAAFAPMSLTVTNR